MQGAPSKISGYRQTTKALDYWRNLAYDDRHRTWPEADSVPVIIAGLPEITFGTWIFRI